MCLLLFPRSCNFLNRIFLNFIYTRGWLILLGDDLFPLLITTTWSWVIAFYFIVKLYSHFIYAAGFCIDFSFCFPDISSKVFKLFNVKRVNFILVDCCWMLPRSFRTQYCSFFLILSHTSLFFHNFDVI